MGGKAFEGITQRIAKDEICGTLTWLTNHWTDSNIQGGNYLDHLLGSAGKNPMSGDIDLNMRIDLYDQAKVADQLTELLGADYVKPRPGNNQIFTAIPINGNPANGYVQVDFMFGDYEWQKFSYFSPALDPSFAGARYYWRQDPTKSCLKGLYRTELIKALVAYNSDWVLEENGEMVARVGPTFFHDRGCVWRYRHRPMRKDGTGRIKELKELTKEEFLEIYPSSISAKADVIIDPKMVVEMVLSERHTIDNLATFETTVLSMQQCYLDAEVTQIVKIYVERLNSLKVDIPLDVFRNFRLKV